MSRRREPGDQEFGSDSFLDIIANIVGILIILIVVAGMKVARQPVTAGGDFEIPPVEQLADVAEPVAGFDALEPIVASPQFDLTEPELPELSDQFPAETGDSPLVDSEAMTSQAPEDERLQQQIEQLTLDLNNVGLEVSASQRRLQDLLQQLTAQNGQAKFLSARNEGMEQEEQVVRESIARLQEELLETETTSVDVQATLGSLTDASNTSRVL